MPESSKWSSNEPSKVLKVFGDTVSQTSFEVRPDKFIGVKLRRMSREVKGMASRMASKELLASLELLA